MALASWDDSQTQRADNTLRIKNTNKQLADIIVENNQAYAAQTTGIHVTGLSHMLRICNSTIEKNNGVGIVCASGAGVKIAGNKFHGNSNEDIRVVGGTPGSSVHDYSSYHFYQNYCRSAGENGVLLDDIGTTA